MAYTLEFASSAARQYRKLPASVQSRLAKALDKLVLNPRHHGCEKLEDALAAYRVRVGDYRIVYNIEDDILVVLVLRVAHRRHVYDQ